MSPYKIEHHPSIPIDPSYIQFFEAFYKTSDTRDAHDVYVDQFTPNATLIMASKQAKGSEEILALRKGLWEKISSRQHEPLKIFPFGSNADEVMIYGTVAYSFREGGNSSLDWAARAHLVKDEGRVKMDFYQVYLDSAAQQSGK